MTARKDHAEREWTTQHDYFVTGSTVCEPEVRAYEAGRARGFAEAVEAAAHVLDHWQQGTLEMVNMGDATLKDIHGEMKKLAKIQRDIRSLTPPTATGGATEAQRDAKLAASAESKRESGGGEKNG